MVRTLGQLIKRRKDFDAILLETTGLADPAPIVYTIQTNSKMSENYFIDSIVCLADCKHLGLHLDEKKPDGSANEALQQVAFADKILLNKIDLVTVEEKKALKDRLATINKFATVIETEKSRAPLDKILGLNSFNMESILNYDPDFFETQEDAKHNLDMVSSVGIQFRGNLHAQFFNIFMSKFFGFCLFPFCSYCKCSSAWYAQNLLSSVFPVTQWICCVNVPPIFIAPRVS